MKSFECNSVVPNCDWRTEGENEEEIFARIEDHAKEKHPDLNLTQDLRDKVRSLIQDDQEAA